MRCRRSPFTDSGTSSGIFVASVSAFSVGVFEHEGRIKANFFHEVDRLLEIPAFAAKPCDYIGAQRQVGYGRAQLGYEGAKFTNGIAASHGAQAVRRTVRVSADRGKLVRPRPLRR